MGRKKESVATTGILNSLKEHGYFRKISDSYQTGIPDILGCYKGVFIGIEVKNIDEVPQDWWVPGNKDHKFSAPQIKELENIYQIGNGVAVALVVCGDQAFWVYQYAIDKDRKQVNIGSCRSMFKRNGKWDVTNFLESCREEGRT